MRGPGRAADDERRLEHLDRAAARRVVEPAQEQERGAASHLERGLRDRGDPGLDHPHPRHVVERRRARCRAGSRARAAAGRATPARRAGCSRRRSQSAVRASSSAAIRGSHRPRACRTHATSFLSRGMPAARAPLGTRRGGPTSVVHVVSGHEQPDARVAELEQVRDRVASAALVVDQTASHGTRREAAVDLDDRDAASDEQLGCGLRRRRHDHARRTHREERARARRVSSVLSLLSPSSSIW